MTTHKSLALQQVGHPLRLFDDDTVGFSPATIQINTR